MEEPYWEVNDDEYEVIDMEAEEKLCNELITKEQAFQIIADNNCTDKMTLACYDALLDGIAEAKAIEAEPIQHWIPVSEGLPKEDGVYLISRNGEVFMAKYHTNADYEMDIDAWMPLPEPYEVKK